MNRSVRVLTAIAAWITLGLGCLLWLHHVRQSDRHLSAAEDRAKNAGKASLDAPAGEPDRAPNSPKIRPASRNRFRSESVETAAGSAREVSIAEAYPVPQHLAGVDLSRQSQEQADAKSAGCIR
ncbi:MAG: hypothetical protein ACKO2P_00040, partial [Planctomycetota bacterium]